jgi:hypothetical protein
VTIVMDGSVPEAAVRATIFARYQRQHLKQLVEETESLIRPKHDDEGLQHQVRCLNLLTNAIILWNSVYMAEALQQLEREGYTVDSEDLHHIWPTRFEHINVYGRYEFNLEEARRRNGLRKLRNPDALDP